MRAVADAGPIHHLVLIDRIAVLPTLLAGVAIPDTVCRELRHPEAPTAVRRWMSAPPAWLAVEPDPVGSDPSLGPLDAGEREAIRLATALGADLILMDGRAGVAAARARGGAVTGTLGIVDLAVRRGLLDVHDAVSRLRATNFRCRPALFEALLARHPRPWHGFSPICHPEGTLRIGYDPSSSPGAGRPGTGGAPASARAGRPG
ncbi:DUF3368 domain-containing protein, partial [Methylobacterium sp. WL116]